MLSCASPPLPGALPLPPPPWPCCMHGGMPLAHDPHVHDAALGITAGLMGDEERGVLGTADEAVRCRG